MSADAPAENLSPPEVRPANGSAPSSRLERLWFAVLRACAVVGFTFYCGWQVYWLARWQIPPSIFLALTGWPAPTTGGTRAVLALLRGDWPASLRFNALAVPMVLLLLVSGGLLAWQALRRRRLRMPPALFRAWVVVLVVAWVVQLSREALARWLPG